MRNMKQLAAIAGLLCLWGAQAQAQEKIVIGFSGPLSGGAALYGKNVLTGLEMAAKEINDAGGVDVGGKKYSLDVVGLDDKYQPSETAVNGKRLAAEYHAPVVVCPHSGGIFALQAFNEQDRFLIGGYTSVPTISERGNKLTLRIPPSFTGYAAPFVKYEMAHYGKKLGIASGDHDYAKAWDKVMIAAWKEAGGEVVSENPMSYNKDTDFYSGVSRVLAAGPDVLFIGGASEPTALVARQAREQGFKGGFAIMDQAKLDEMAKVTDGYAMLDGSIGVLPMAEDHRPGLDSFVARFKKIYNRDPSSEVALNYAALNAFAEAMKLAGTTSDPAAIFARLGDAFKALPPERNPALITSVDDKGRSNSALVIGVVENGKIMPLEAKR